MEIRHSVITKYLMPDERYVARISAISGKGRLIHTYNLQLTREENHRMAAEKLLDKWGWDDGCNWLITSVHHNVDGYIHTPIRVVSTDGIELAKEVSR